MSRPGNHTFEKTIGLNPLEWQNLRSAAGISNGPGLSGLRQKCAQSNRRLACHLDGMGAEDMKGIGVLAPNNEEDFFYGGSRFAQ